MDDAPIDSAAPPPLTPQEILAVLSRESRVQPLAALAAADEQREALTPVLLDAMIATLESAESATDEEANLFTYALYLFAKWRETRAHPLMSRWLSLPGEQAFDLAGDVVNQDGPRMLAATCGGNIEAITALIMNANANEWCRAAGIDALAVLVAWENIPRGTVVAYYQWLHTWPKASRRLEAGVEDASR